MRLIVALLTGVFLASCSHSEVKSSVVSRAPAHDRNFSARRCRVHADCASGVPCLFGECAGEKPMFDRGLNGDLCQLATDCMSGLCGSLNISGLSVCLPSSAYKSIDGEICSFAIDCKSNICDSRHGYCLPNPGDGTNACLLGGSPCELHADCCSGECSQRRCLPHRFGDACVLDKDCESGVCNTTVTPARCWYPRH